MDEDRDLGISKNRYCHAAQQCAGVDALPALKNATTVELLQIDEDGGKDGEGRDPSEDALPATAVIEVLAAHGLRPSLAMVRAHKEDVGELICRRATNQGADLIVMGCYGHAATRDGIRRSHSPHASAHAVLVRMHCHSHHCRERLRR